VILLYLPPYSPDFNLIEKFFSVLKAWLKRHYKLAEDMSFEAYLHMAMGACSKGHFAAGHFRHAGITVNIDTN